MNTDISGIASFLATSGSRCNSAGKRREPPGYEPGGSRPVVSAWDQAFTVGLLLTQVNNTHTWVRTVVDRHELINVTSLACSRIRKRITGSQGHLGLQRSLKGCK